MHPTIKLDPWGDGIFAEDLIVIESHLALPALTVHAPLTEVPSRMCYGVGHRASPAIFANSEV